MCKNNLIQLGGQCENIYCDISNGAKITYIQKDIKHGFGIIAVDEEGEKHLWWHFDNINPDLSVGDKIESGDLLGVAGNTGYSTGAHLHRGYYRWNEDPNNGYEGATNPEPYFTNIFVLDYIDTLKKQLTIFQRLVVLWQKIKNLINLIK